jgi:hypothetical protein
MCSLCEEYFSLNFALVKRAASEYEAAFFYLDTARIVILLIHLCLQV